MNTARLEAGVTVGLLLFFVACAGANDGALPVGRTGSDAAGRFSVWIDFPEQPVTVHGGSEEGGSEEEEIKSLARECGVRP